MNAKLESAKESQRAYVRGECDLATVQAAQRDYDLDRTAPEREAAAARQRQDWERQRQVWASIGENDIPIVRALAVEADCVREVVIEVRCQPVTIRKIVPPTSHWANWQDKDAILHHGKTCEILIERFLAISREPWDGTYAHLWFADGLSD